MTGTSHVPALFAGLVDDAALFPPGNAPMGVAVRDHIAHRGTWYADFVGPFVCSDAHLDGVMAEIDRLPPSAEPLGISLVLPKGVESVAGAVAAVDRDKRLRLAGVEVATGAGPDAINATRTAVGALQTAGVPADCRTYVEVPHDGVDDAVAVVAGGVAGGRIGAKLRTGGANAAAFPSEETVAAFIRRCLDQGVQFKCTAGLHHAVRHTAADTGFEHHGFLNVILAVDRALGGAGIDDLVGVLGERDYDAVVAMVSELDDSRSRDWFDSFGTCSVLEPLDDLVDLGLVTAADVESFGGVS